MAYNRINLDGQGISETRLAAAATAPGTVVVINGSDKFAAATADAVGRLYVAGIGDHQGLSIDEQTPADDSLAAYYMEEGREFAVLAAADTYAKDTPLSVGASGVLVEADGTKNIVAFSQDAVTLADTGLLRVRVRNVTSNGFTG